MKGIVAQTKNGKVFFFGTEIQSEVEDAMHLLGYGSHDYWLRFGNLEIEKPAPAPARLPDGGE